MNIGRTVFSQLMDFIPTYEFQLCVDRYHGNRYVKGFSCWEQFLCMAFAQLTYREGLRDIEACLRAQERGESAYPVGCARLHSSQCLRDRSPSSRCQSARSISTRTRSRLFI